MHRYHGKPDSNQHDVMQDLEHAGLPSFSIADVGHNVPDIIVACPVTDKMREAWCWANLLVELKSPGGQLTEGQRIWHEWWLGPKMTAWSAEDILRYVVRI